MRHTLTLVALTAAMSACSDSSLRDNPRPDEKRYAYALELESSTVFYLGREGILEKRAAIDAGGKIGEKWTRIEVPGTVASGDAIDLASDFGVKVGHEFLSADPLTTNEETPVEKWFRIDFVTEPKTTTGSFAVREDGSVAISVHFEGWSNVWELKEPIWVVFDIDSALPLAESD